MMEEYKKTIERNFSEFKVETIEKAGEGWDSLALRVNNEYIFRFPKREGTSQNLTKEICLLPKLSQSLTLAIPKFDFVGTQNNGLKFVGYKEIKGECLSKAILGKLSENESDLLAKEIAGFFTELHGFSVKEAFECGIQREDSLESYSNYYNKIKNLAIFNEFPQKTKDYIKEIFETFLSNTDNFIYVPALVHKDLSADHVIFDTVTKKVQGIIDFGDVAIADPDYDLTWFYIENPDLLDKILKHYPVDDKGKLFTKLKSFASFIPFYAITHGLEHEDLEKLENGLMELEKAVNNK